MMKHEKMNFAGVEMDVVIGHPEHELLFVAKQVADAAGLRNGSQSILDYRKYHKITMLEVSDMPPVILETLRGSRYIQLKSKLISEPDACLMLLRGRAPQSEPFRKWVTEEVLPSIRKTGQYDIAKSTTPEAMRK
ncbi:MAG: BRO family protein [Pantoea sp.]|nr:BRO family protein [Pantoea sp.]